MKRLLLMIATVLALAGCGDKDKPAPTAPGDLAADPGPIHVHGLGINPADGALFIATHTGLFRAASDQETATRVAGRYQDTMASPWSGQTDLGSGHPDPRSELPPYLGPDPVAGRGRILGPVSLLGKSDFHVLEAAGETVYGYGSDFDTRKPHLLVSTDGGDRWQKRTAARTAHGGRARGVDARDRDQTR